MVQALSVAAAMEQLRLEAPRKPVTIQGVVSALRPYSALRLTSGAVWYPFQMTDAKNYSNGRCCVFQPFDNGGDFDNRFADTLAPAIEEAHMEPYRVDRDPESVIPVETLHTEIRAATICLADITTRNPNVMYEVGFAIAAEKDVIIISGPSEDKYPFDIQHRGILRYATGSKRNYDKLGSDLTDRIKATLTRQAKAQKVVSSSPVKSSDGLHPHELTVLALIMANSEAVGDPVGMSWLKQEMRKATYNEVGTRMALARLTQLGYTEVIWRRDFDNRYAMYALTDSGESWLCENQSKLLLTTQRSVEKVPDYNETGTTDEDIPY